MIERSPAPASSADSVETVAPPVPAPAATGVASAPSGQKPGFLQRLVGSLFQEPGSSSASEALATSSPAVAPTPASRAGDSEKVATSPDEERGQTSSETVGDQPKQRRPRNRRGRGKGNQETGERTHTETTAKELAEETGEQDREPGVHRNDETSGQQDESERPKRRSRRGGRRRRNKTGDEGTLSESDAPNETPSAPGQSDSTTLIEARNAIDPASRQPDPDVLAASKRQPTRDRAAISQSKEAAARSKPSAATATEMAATTAAVTSLTSEATEPTAEVQHPVATETPETPEAAQEGQARINKPVEADTFTTSVSRLETNTESVADPTVTETLMPPSEAATDETAPATGEAEAPRPTEDAGAEADLVKPEVEGDDAAEDSNGRPQRALNDPREVRRRRREAELKAQGVMPKG